jgi:hypothetical protein
MSNVKLAFFVLKRILKKKKKLPCPCGVGVKAYLPAILNPLADRFAKKDKIRLYLRFHTNFSSSSIIFLATWLAPSIDRRTMLNVLPSVAQLGQGGTTKSSYETFSSRMTLEKKGI